MEALDALLQVSTLAGTQHAHLLVVATITKKCNVLQTKSFLSWVTNRNTIMTKALDLINQILIYTVSLVYFF